MVTGDEMAFLMFLVAIVISVYIYYMLEKELRPIVKTISYDNLGVRTKDPKTDLRVHQHVHLQQSLTIVPPHSSSDWVVPVPAHLPGLLP